MFKNFKLLVENQFGRKIKELQSDNGGEFKSFVSFLTGFIIQSHLGKYTLSGRSGTGSPGAALCAVSAGR